MRDEDAHMRFSLKKSGEVAELAEGARLLSE